MVHAMRDPDGPNLDRIQIIKGWLGKDGKTQERIFDVAVSGGRKIGAGWPLQDAGRQHGGRAERDLHQHHRRRRRCRRTGRTRRSMPRERAFYYVRVIQIPSPRWTAYDQKRYGIKMPDNVPMTVTDRAYTSPDLVHAGKVAHVANHMKQLIREPLVHFLLLGAAIFVAYSLVSKGSSGEPGKIVVSQGQLASMREGFIRTRQRAPTREEWEGLIRARVREEVYYREALALGLDKDDTVIRRRLQQKMEFVSDDIAAQAPADRRRAECVSAGAPRRVSRGATVHVPPGVSQPGEARREPRARRRATARAVEPGRRPMPMSRRWAIRSCWATQFDAVPAGEIARQFGDAFAAKLGGLRPANGRAGRVRLRRASGVRQRTHGRTRCPRWRTCATPCAVSGTRPAGWKRKRGLTRRCSSVTR